MITEEDKKFLEEKFGDGSDMSQTTPEEWERYRKIKEEEKRDTQDNQQIEKKLFPHTCLRCKYHWNSEVEIPIACAKCRSRVWDKPRKSAKRKG